MNTLLEEAVNVHYVSADAALNQVGFACVYSSVVNGSGLFGWAES